jgi:hypothetical protein
VQRFGSRIVGDESLNFTAKVLFELLVIFDPPDLGGGVTDTCLRVGLHPARQDKPAYQSS